MRRGRRSIIVRLLELIDDEDGDIGVRNRRPEFVQFGELAAVHFPLAILADDSEPALLVCSDCAAWRPGLAVLSIDLRGVRHQQLEGNVGERQRAEMQVDLVSKSGEPLVELAQGELPDHSVGFEAWARTER